MFGKKQSFRKITCPDTTSIVLAGHQCHYCDRCINFCHEADFSTTGIRRLKCKVHEKMPRRQSHQVDRPPLPLGEDGSLVTRTRTPEAAEIWVKPISSLSLCLPGGGNKGQLEKPASEHGELYINIFELIQELEKQEEEQEEDQESDCSESTSDFCTVPSFSQCTMPCLGAGVKLLQSFALEDLVPKRRHLESLEADRPSPKKQCCSLSELHLDSELPPALLGWHSF